MDADLVRLVRLGKISRSLAQQRASVPEELQRLLGGEGAQGGSYGDAASYTPPSYTAGG
jgi:hypothetical protein